MRNLVLAAAFAALTLAGCSQPQNAQTEGGSAAAPSLSPEMRTKMQRIRLDAKTGTLNALSAAHRKVVLATAKQFDDGAISIPEAANMIDANLTPQETSAVLAQQTKMRAAMREVFSQDGASGVAGRGRGQAGSRAPDAGRFLLQVCASPEKWRAAMRNSSPATAAP